MVTTGMKYKSYLYSQILNLNVQFSFSWPNHLSYESFGESIKERFNVK